MFFSVALLGKKVNKICIQANSKQDVVNTTAINVAVIVQNIRRKWCNVKLALSISSLQLGFYV